MKPSSALTWPTVDPMPMTATAASIAQRAEMNAIEDCCICAFIPDLSKCTYSSDDVPGALRNAAQLTRRLLDSFSRPLAPTADTRSAPSAYVAGSLPHPIPHFARCRSRRLPLLRRDVPAGNA